MPHSVRRALRHRAISECKIVELQTGIMYKSDATSTITIPFYHEVVSAISANNDVLVPPPISFLSGMRPWTNSIRS